MDETYEVVWNGGELLPPRDSVPDGRWIRIPNPWEWDERPLSDPGRARAMLRKKRLYNKNKHEYWRRRKALRPRAVRSRSTGRSGKTAPSGTGVPGYTSQHLPSATPDATATIIPESLS